eukprot:1173925-Prorocentrum_minimum.AAC.2
MPLWPPLSPPPSTSAKRPGGISMYSPTKSAKGRFPTKQMPTELFLSACMMPTSAAMART